MRSRASHVIDSGGHIHTNLGVYWFRGLSVVGPELDAGTENMGAVGY